MIEKDNIQDLFSKAFENHASAVKPELWAGVQAKMAAAGAVGGTAAVKGISALTKWIIGTAAVTTVGVTTALVLNNTKENETPKIENSTPATTNQVAAENNENSKTQNLTSYNGKTLKGQTAGISNNTINPTDVSLSYSGEPNGENQTVSTGFNGQPNGVSNNETKPKTSNGSSVAENNSTAGNSETKPKTTVSEVNPSSNIRETNETKPEVKEAKIEIANVFTPNADGKNDYFELISHENVAKFNITVYDQNGVKVFVSDDVNFQWDGNNMSNEQCKTGILSYVVICYNEKGEAKRYGDYLFLTR